VSQKLKGTVKHAILRSTRNDTVLKFNKAIADTAFVYMSDVRLVTVQQNKKLECAEIEVSKLLA
jgi:hypothetical protein